MKTSATGLLLILMLVLVGSISAGAAYQYATNEYEAAFNRISAQKVEEYNARAVLLSDLDKTLADGWVMKVYAGENGLAQMVVKSYNLMDDYKFVRIRTHVDDADWQPIFTSGDGDRTIVLRNWTSHIFFGPGITELSQFTIDFYMWNDPTIEIDICSDSRNCKKIEFAFQQAVGNGEHSTQFNVTGPIDLRGYQLYTSGYQPFWVRMSDIYNTPAVWAGMSTNYVAAVYSS